MAIYAGTLLLFWTCVLLKTMKCDLPPKYSLSQSDAFSFLTLQGFILCGESDCEGHGFDCGTNIKDQRCQAHCASNPCLHYGICYAGGHTFQCYCQDGYTGLICDTDINECGSSPCKNGGTCNDGVNRFTCSCRSGYAGNRCEIDVNECDSSPCVHGTCHDRINGFDCSCQPGYTGSRCEIDIDECASSPCAERATCLDQINSFHCVCPKGYYGVLCDTNVCHPTPADVVFLLDSSVSMTEKQFKKQLEFVANFTDQVLVGPKDFQIGVITFSFDAHVEFYLNNFTSNVTLKEAVKNIKFRPGATFTHKALNMVPHLFYAENGGERRLNGTMPDRFVFLLTDGMSTERKETKRQTDILKSRCQGRFQIYTIGIGNEVSHEELIYIASQPSLVYSAQDFDSLYTVLKKLVQLTCENCYQVSVSDVALIVDTSHDLGLKQFDDTRDILTYFVHMVDLGINKTRLSLTAFDSAIHQVFRSSDDKTRDAMTLEINRLQISDDSGPTIDIVDLLTHIYTTAFFDARPSSKLIAVIFTDGRFQIKNHSKIIKIKEDLLSKNISVVFVAIGDVVDLDNIYSISDDAFDVYMADPENKHNLDVIKTYMTYSVCSIEDD